MRALDGARAGDQGLRVRFEISRSADAVEVWSDRRLPFEPKGDALRMRDELRAALRELPSSPAMTAEYTSDALGLCDVENVLHYNVGPAAMGHLCAEHLAVERLFSAPCPSPTNEQFRHHVRYRRGAHERVSWSDGALVAHRRFVLPADSPLDVANMWFHARRAAATPPALNPVATSKYLTSVVDVRVPVARRVHAGAMLKTIVDGVVSSLHTHDRSDIAELVTRLSARIRAARRPSEVDDLLLHGSAELGTRRLLFLRADGVQWNPADDGFTALTARVSTGDQHEQEIEIDARVFVAVPRK